MKLSASGRSGMKLLLAAVCAAAMIQTSASQSNTTSAVSATAAPATTNGQNNTDSINATLPSGFPATTSLISVARPVTQAPVTPPKDCSSEETFNCDEKPERSSEEKKRKKEKKKKTKKLNY